MLYLLSVEAGRTQELVLLDPSPFNTAPMVALRTAGAGQHFFGLVFTVSLAALAAVFVLLKIYESCTFCQCKKQRLTLGGDL